MKSRLPVYCLPLGLVDLALASEPECSVDGCEQDLPTAINASTRVLTTADGVLLYPFPAQTFHYGK